MSKVPTRSKAAQAEDLEKESENEEQAQVIDGFRADSSEFRTKIEQLKDGGELYDFLANKVPLSAFIWGRTHTFNRALAALYRIDLLPQGMSRKFGKYRKKEKKELRQVFVSLTQNPANRAKFMAVKQSCVLGDAATTRLKEIDWPQDSADVDHIESALSVAKVISGTSSSSTTKVNKKRGRDGTHVDGKGTPSAILEAAASLEGDIGTELLLLGSSDEPAIKMQKQTILQMKAQQEKLKNWQIQSNTLQNAIGSEAFKTLPANVKQQLQDAWVASLLEKPSFATADV